MKANIIIDDAAFLQAKKDGFDECIETINKRLEALSSSTPYIKGIRGLRDYLVNASASTVYNMKAEGLPYYEVCGVTYFKKEEVDAYIEKHKQQTTE